MPRTTADRSPLRRLLRLLLLLQSNRYLNSRRLSEELGVGRRTIFRDFVILEEAGLAIDYYPDRMGYGLSREGEGCSGSSTPEEIEVASLIVLAELWGGRDGLDLIRRAREGLVKVVGSRSIESRDRLNSIWVPLERPILERPKERRPIYDGLLDALGRRYQVRLEYQDPGDAARFDTKVSPYRIVLSQTMWCVIGRSSHHRGVGLFRVPYIQRLCTTKEPYSIPPRFDMTPYLAGVWVTDPHEASVEQEVFLRFSSLVAPEVLDSTWHFDQRAELLEDGRVELRFPACTGEDLVRWLLGFGDQVEILTPSALRARVREIAQRMWKRHSQAAVSEGPSESPRIETTLLARRRHTSRRSGIRRFGED
ncbi:MAG: WYL domain-containing transcriptional regulator [Isosphaeraceae bacterium]|nr:WYL domain-containing transcriptional regulator [Isosphaeraceae bacterium]